MDRSSRKLPPPPYGATLKIYTAQEIFIVFRKHFIEKDEVRGYAD
jgi:hypothetical protein